MGALPASASGAVLPVLSVDMAGENSGLSWWKMTWYRNGAASVATTIFSPMLVVVLRAVLDLGLALYGGGERGGVWLQHWAEGQPIGQIWKVRHKSQESTNFHIVVGGCVKHLCSTRRFGLVSPPPILGRPQRRLELIGKSELIHIK